MHRLQLFVHCRQILESYVANKDCSNLNIAINSCNQRSSNQHNPRVFSSFQGFKVRGYYQKTTILLTFFTKY